MSKALVITLGGRKYPALNLQKALRKIGMQWRKNARISLTKQKRNNTGNLSKSIGLIVGQDKDGFFVDITPSAPYWPFVDLGVQGASYNKFGSVQAKSPFKFGKSAGKKRSPNGLRSAIDRWTVQKNIKGTRDEQGRFVPRESIVQAISRGIWYGGLKPSLFISGTGDRIEKKATKQIGIALEKDYANAMKKDMSRDKNLKVT